MEITGPSRYCPLVVGGLVTTCIDAVKVSSTRPGGKEAVVVTPSRMERLPPCSAEMVAVTGTETGLPPPFTSGK